MLTRSQESVEVIKLRWSILGRCSDINALDVTIILGIYLDPQSRVYTLMCGL
jgi:hypothetical protein